MPVPTVSLGSYDIFQIAEELRVGTLVDITAQLNKHLEICHNRSVVLDFSGTQMLDSSAIRFLINLNKRLDENKQGFFILKPSPEVMNILQSVNLTKVLTIYQDCLELEHTLAANRYARFLPFTENEDGVRRISCSCAACGSTSVIGYLIDENNFDWRWEADNPFPLSYDKTTTKFLDAFSLLPIVCQDCYMCSLDISLFNILSGGAIAIKSKLDDGSKLLLSKSIKKRKKMMEAEVGAGDDFFNHPRQQNAAYSSYILAESCARSVSIGKKEADPFTIGFMNYMAIKYSTTEDRDSLIDNCRTWLSQILTDRSRYTTIQLAKTYFMLIVVNLDMKKSKEAGQLKTMFEDLIKNLSDETTVAGLNSPRFWYKQATLIWNMEIKNQTAALKV